MKTFHLTIPELGMIVGTRAMIGAGIAFLLSGHLSLDQRKAVGWTLFLVGAVSSLPLGFELLAKRDEPSLAPGRD